MEINSKILKLAWDQLCMPIFNELCPGYSNQPQAALKHIRQSYINADGNLVCTPVFTYYQRMMNAMHPFASNIRFPKSVNNALIDGLDKHLMPIFCRNHANHALQHNLEASFQRSRFGIIRCVMTMAKDEVQSISAIARSSVGRQTFKSNVLAFPS